VTLLSIKDLSLSFGTSQVLDNVSFTIEPGEMVAVVGESGSGKSLTALSCLGLQPASAAISGEITLHGTPILSASPNKLRSLRGSTASMIFQEPMTALNPLHTIGKQISEIIRLHQKGAVDVKARTVELLEEVGLTRLTSRLGAYPHELSGGERQRVMIAMAIANSPKLLIADEPTTAVDVTVQAKILKLLKELQATRQMAMLFITHDLTLVKRLADRVVVMKNGRIVEQGKVADIFASPKEAYTRELLASEPKGSMPPLTYDEQLTISCESLKVYFPIKTGLFRRTTGYVKAVDDISVSLPKMSTIGVVGESGSGKSTLGFALLKLLKSKGTIIWLGRDISAFDTASMRPLRSDMQVVFQDPYSSLNPRKNIRQILAEGLTIHAPHSGDHEERINAILTEVGLPPEAAERYPHEFSGGQRQRIAIARAMILKPKFVVLDEPTSALDLTVQTQIIELLKRFQQEYGISYLFISHDLRVIRASANHIIVMRAGKVVEQGCAKSIFETPQDDYTRALINAAFLKG